MEEKKVAQTRRQRRRHLASMNPKEKKEKVFAPDRTLEKVDFSGGFDDQLDSVMVTFRLTQEDVANLDILFEDLESVLQNIWPGCTAIPFGSITTGLGFKTSDADCFISIPAEHREQDPKFVHKVRSLLKNHPQTFSKIKSIPRSDVPLVKFFHKPTKTECDTTFKSPLGTRNSKLITFLLHADSRIIPMAVAIKCWAKVHRLSGTTKLKNYALAIMIIFYLQQPPISILPSVEWLQRNSEVDQIIDYWNAGFMNESSKLPPCLNTSSVSELLGGFFEYYSTFNFEEYVICPYLGKTIKKTAFINLDELPVEFQRYKDNVKSKYVQPLKHKTPFCIQDPINHCHNVALPIRKRLSTAIKQYIKFAADKYEEEKLKNCDNFLKSILLEKPKTMEKRVPNSKENFIVKESAVNLDNDNTPHNNESI